MTIPFNRPFMTGNELAYIHQCHEHSQLSGDGPFTKKCHQWLEATTKTNKALLTHSCTAALEMAALLLDICPGDEVIMPSYTFVSTANAFVLRGGVPVFVDIRADTLNLDETLIESAITDRTRAIVPVHYAGVACEMDVIMNIAARYKLAVVEDAAQAVMSRYKGRALGSIGDLGTYSFHETKNVISGEGGALLVNSSHLAERAEIIREKGTDRSRFYRGQVDKYTWQDQGSSFLPGELIAAFLWAQLEQANEITLQRLKLWNYYNEAFSNLDSNDYLRRPCVPKECEHNAHMFYVRLTDSKIRDRVIRELASNGINSVFHYIPLHSSPAGQKYARAQGDLSVTDEAASAIIRLPLWIGMSESEQQQTVTALEKILTA